MRQALAGLVVASGLYVLGWLFWVRLARLWWSLQPGDVPPELQGMREKVAGWQMRSLLQRPQRESMWWLAVAAVIFALLWVADFGLAVLVVYVAVLSAAWTPGTVIAGRRRSRERFAGAGIRPVQLGGLGRPSFTLGLYLAAWMIWAGTVGTICFLGGLVAAALN